jgi:hypothetical protein
MMVMILGLGIRNYLRDAYNVFDTLIVLISIVDSILNLSNISIGGRGAE